MFVLGSFLRFIVEHRLSARFVVAQVRVGRGVEWLHGFAVDL